MDAQVAGRRMTVFARLGETVLLQVEQGLLPPDAMDRLGYRPWKSFMNRPKSACVWPLIGGVSDSFRAYVEDERQPNTVNCRDFEVPSAL